MEIATRPDTVQRWRQALYDAHDLKTYQGRTYPGVFAEIYNYLAAHHARINSELEGAHDGK